jgi:hypothetical protein
MNKFAIIFIPIILALHFLMAPQNLIPNGWIDDIQQGKKVAQLFITFYRAQSAAGKSIETKPKAEATHPPRPLVHHDLIAMADLQPADQALKECDLVLKKIDFKKMEWQISRRVHNSMRIVILKKEIFAAVGPGQPTVGISGL